MSLRSSVCPDAWLPIGCGTGGALSCTEYEGLDPVTQAAVLQAAVDYLWNWSGRQYGLCPVTIRPCRESCLDWNTTYRGHGRGNSYPGLPWYGGAGQLQPALIGGEWFNLPCGNSCSGPCSCGPVEQVDLGGGVDSVTEVRIDGVALASNAYRVDNSRWLVRTDGGTWPDCQDMSADPETDDGTFSVTYLNGVPVPPGGQLAAAALACELARQVCGGAGCKPPSRATRVSRQGVEISFDGLAEVWTRGSVGIFVVDTWLASVNTRRRGGGRVASPDYVPVRRTTSP